MRFVARNRVFNQQRSGPVKIVGVMGAGDAGAMMVRELQNNPQLKMYVVAFFDDDLSKHGMRLHGVTVAGGREQIPTAVKRLRLGPGHHRHAHRAPARRSAKWSTSARRRRCRPRSCPACTSCIGGRVSVNQLRDVNIEDLLRREPVETDTAAVGALLRGRRVLVTGGGGSIGRELCRQILRCEPAELILLGHGENSIFEIHHELRLRAAGPRAIKVTPLIADIRFAERVDAPLPPATGRRSSSTPPPTSTCR